MVVVREVVHLLTEDARVDVELSLLARLRGMVPSDAVVYQDGHECRIAGTRAHRARRRARRAAADERVNRGERNGQQRRAHEQPRTHKKGPWGQYPHLGCDVDSGLVRSTSE